MMARAKTYISKLVAALRGEALENPANTASTMTGAPLVPPTPAQEPVVFPPFGSDPKNDLRDKAIENLARFVGIVDSSIPQLAAGTTNNGVRMPGIVTPYNGRFVISKHYPQHPNTPDLSYADTASEAGSAASSARGRGGFRGGRGRGRGGRGGQGGNGGEVNGGDGNGGA